jgi:hypothetical protein
MIRSVTGRAPKVMSLAQQNTEFTAEGSPPPGQVGTTVPVTAEATATSLPSAPAVRRSAGKPLGKGR